MSLPILPAPRRSDLSKPSIMPLTSEHVTALVAALETVSPRAAAVARRTITAPEATASADTIDVSVTIDAALPAEGYTISLTTAGWVVSVADEDGAFWAVETLAQILRGGTVPEVEISDSPSFAVRGFMLDIARFFVGPAEIKKVIDIAAGYKLNRLHLHLTDDQGWRIEIENRPLLTTVAADHDVAGGHGGFLSIADYEDLQDYAHARNIVIVPEIDLPGHSHAAQIAYPEISPDGKTREPYIGTKVGFSSLHLTSDEAWAWVDDVVASMAKHTRGEYIHLGGDESLTLTREDYLVYMERLAKVCEKHGKKVVFWQEAGGAPLPAGARLQYWTKNVETGHLARIAREQDVQFISSPATRAYLDMQYTKGYRIGQDWAAIVEVEDAYDWDPVAVLPGIPAESVVGVEACLWTETLRSFDDLTELLLPRLPAVASVAWGSPKDFARFTAALATHGTWWDADGITYYRSPQVDWA